MAIEERRQGEAVVLAPRGSLRQPAACGELEQRLAALLQERVRFYVLDARELAGLGSAALRALLRLQRSLRPLQGRLVFCGLDARLRETLEVAGFGADFALAEDVEAALAQLPAGATATLAGSDPGYGEALLAALSSGRPALGPGFAAQGPPDAQLVELLGTALAGTGRS